MSRGGQTRVSRTKGLPKPNHYVRAIYEQFQSYCFDEEQAPTNKGRWREHVFKAPQIQPLDLEIGMGNGFHFAHRAGTYPDRLLLGIELKYKPLIQSIRRATQGGSHNVRAMRWNAALVSQVFADEELNDVFIHFPDPWSRQRQHKHRLIQDQFLKELFQAQRPGSVLEFKTDNRDYFLWSMDRFARSPYGIERQSEDLHSSPWVSSNFVTQFERIFLQQGLPIHYALLRRT